jgi:hypothetical protein
MSTTHSFSAVASAHEFLSLYRAAVFNAAELDEIRLNGLNDD